MGRTGEKLADYTGCWYRACARGSLWLPLDGFIGEAKDGREHSHQNEIHWRPGDPCRVFGSHFGSTLRLSYKYSIYIRRCDQRNLNYPTAPSGGFSAYCSFPLISMYALCITGLYLGGLSSSAHSGIHWIIVSLSGLTKYGIEYRARVIRFSPVKRSPAAGNVTRCSVDFR
jgi:hypothetical protein